MVIPDGARSILPLGGERSFLKFNREKAYSFSSNARGTELCSIQSGTHIDPELVIEESFA